MKTLGLKKRCEFESALNRKDSKLLLSNLFITLPILNKRKVILIACLSVWEEERLETFVYGKKLSRDFYGIEVPCVIQF